MANILTQLDIIHQKMQQLLKKQELLQKENESLKKDIKAISEKEQHQLNTIKDLQQKLQVAQLGTQTWNEEDKKLLRKKIDAYLREIDYCLQQLHTA